VSDHAFDSWWETHGQPYEAKVIENGGQPWTRDIDQRRELWERRYTRPAPPAGLLTDLSKIRKDYAA
jgi:hypothetical protein